MDNKYNLNSATDRGYVRGIWASFLNYRKSNKMFYWGGCIDFVRSVLKVFISHAKTHIVIIRTLVIFIFKKLFQFY